MPLTRANNEPEIHLNMTILQKGIQQRKKGRTLCLSADKDISAWGSFLIMGVFGLIIAMVVNIFLASSALQFAISAIGVLIFSGLTAYDTQNIKEMYFDGDDVLVAGRKAVIGALRLYLDFINLFTFLLQFLGNRN